MHFAGKKIIVAATLCVAIFGASAFAQKEHGGHDEKASNLKVLPKDISEDSLHKVMHEYSMSLGVHCNFCHESKKIEGQERPQMDFASDSKPEKDIARDMMRMTEIINTQYLAKMGDHHLDQITCVTCHMGKTSPTTSVDSLMKTMKKE